MQGKAEFDPAEGSSLVHAAAAAMLLVALPHPLRVAVDGRTACGKTTFADALAAALEASGRRIIRASIDGFHQPRAVRHRQGRLSPDGYYEDARDLAALSRYLLEPLGPGGDRRFAIATFDLARDAPIEPAFHLADEQAVLIVDGTFLQRRELRGQWDFVVYLDVADEEARRRGIERDCAAMGGRSAAASLYDRRYRPAFVRYEKEAGPVENADLVIRF